MNPKSVRKLIDVCDKLAHKSFIFRSDVFQFLCKRALGSFEKLPETDAQVMQMISVANSYWRRSGEPKPIWIAAAKDNGVLSV